MQAYDLTGTAASILAQPAASESLRRHDIATDAALCFAMFAVCDALAYLCVAAMRHVEATQPPEQPACSLHVRLMLPLEGWDVAADVPYLLELKRRHGARCVAAMAAAAGKGFV